ncbi:MAG TPA: polysaccharide biosynthesis tyrosine autokinase [Thermoanaerobaculia bacterium]|nr:polysaccharide biosynthesis tyrosine autokinase [Thermoanaerobaculia bacterium]
MDLNTTEVHLSHYWTVIQKRWKVAFSILAVVMLGTVLTSYLSKPLYQSKIEIQIERENPNQVTMEDFFGIAASDQEFLQTQYVLLKSRGLAQRVIDEQKLLSDPEFYPAGIANKTPKEIEGIRDSMVGAVVGGIDIQPVRNTSLVDITYITTSPRLAQKVAEGLGDSFMRMKVEQKFQAVRTASEFLDRQIAQVKTDIESTRKQMQQYGENKGIISADEATNMTQQRLLKTNADLSTAEAEIIARRTEYDSLTRTSPEIVAAKDARVSALTDEESKLQREYQQKGTNLTPQHPEMQKLKVAIDKTAISRQVAVKEAYSHALETARQAVTSAEQRYTQLGGALSQQTRATMAVNVTAIGYADLQKTLEGKQALLERLFKQQNETEVTARLRGSETSNVHWVDHANLPGSRFNVTMKKNLQSALPLGVILGLAAIFFLEYMDRSIKTAEELERVTKFASLGVIPAAASVGRGYGYYGSGMRSSGSGKLRAVQPLPEQSGIDLLPHLDSRSPISEAYRAFRTSLLLASANSPKIIVITSTFAKEGKTTTSINLATVLAQMGKPVLLVDADLRRPRLQKVFKGKMNLGLVNYLAANIPLEDVIQETSVPNLSVVLSGPNPPNPSELLASDRMKALIHEVRSKFAYVIFDSPPVLAVTDAVVLAANADGVVLCVHGGQTPRDLVLRSSERLRQSNIPVLGAILNNLDLQQYGYTYKKSYYDYYDSEDRRAAAPPPKQRVG